MEKERSLFCGVRHERWVFEGREKSGGKRKLREKTRVVNFRLIMSTTTVSCNHVNHCMKTNPTPPKITIKFVVYSSLLTYPS